MSSLTITREHAVAFDGTHEIRIVSGLSATWYRSGRRALEDVRKMHIFMERIRQLCAGIAFDDVLGDAALVSRYLGVRSPPSPPSPPPPPQ
jgi:hypothetical protein